MFIILSFLEFMIHEGMDFIVFTNVFLPNANIDFHLFQMVISCS